MANEDIRKALKDSHMKQWQLADRLGLAEAVLTRKLRFELPEERKQQMFAIIAQWARTQDAKATQRELPPQKWPWIKATEMLPALPGKPSELMDEGRSPAYYSEDVLVTTNAGEVFIARYSRYEWYDAEWDYEWETNDNDYAGSDLPGVIAWMPLPEPYDNTEKEN